MHNFLYYNLRGLIGRNLATRIANTVAPSGISYGHGASLWKPQRELEEIFAQIREHQAAWRN